MIKNEKSEVELFFESLGYRVDWDFSHARCEIWWEIFKGQKMICQIEQGPSVDDLIKDFRHNLYGEKEESPVRYWIAAPESPEFDEFEKKVADYEGEYKRKS